MSDFSNSRRNFLRTLTSTTVLSGPLLNTLAIPTGAVESMGKLDNGLGLYDGPESPLFNPVAIRGNKNFSEITDSIVSKKMADVVSYAPAGESTAWGIPFQIAEKIIFIKDTTISIEVKHLQAGWLVFMHTSDIIDMEKNEDGFYKKPFTGFGQLNEHTADYIVIYEDGTEVSAEIRQRHQIGMFQARWGENNTESQGFHKPVPIRAHHEQMNRDWGRSQWRTRAVDRSNWISWLWGWENPHPEKNIAGFRFEPVNKNPVVLSAISAGRVHSNPLRWQSRQKAVLSLPAGTRFNPTLDEEGLLSQIKLDMGQIISAAPQLRYPDKEWPETYDNKLPQKSDRDVLIEYTAHPEANFHLNNKKQIPVSKIDKKSAQGYIRPIKPASQLVKLRVVEKNSTKPVTVKIHIHGESGEYLAPIDRNRIPNNAMFEDYSVDVVYRGIHNCSYIPGETTIKLPLGKVYVEISKGFEIKPVKKVISVTPATKNITIEIEKVIPWREMGWVTADTHVHFLSPSTAMMEGAGEGVNIVNLLASQWGELMTNVGDFDGKTTYGSREAGGEGEYMVRVGTENRQHVLGHISLLGYEGSIIAPMTTGGPTESALGDPIEVLLTEWGKQCIKQNGLVVLPHFPHPRMENAAAIVTGNVHAAEVCRTIQLHEGIDAYSLSDWYRYLNCGYFTAAVGGTDKMDAGMPLGAVRTYAKIDDDREFTYDEWKKSVIKGHTFVTCGPLMNFSVDGKLMGSKIKMSATGGTVDVEWQAASVSRPMTRVELIVNGEVRESAAVSKEKGNGVWSVKIDKSSWLALLIRGYYNTSYKSEIIAAHSSPVMINVQGSQMMAAADAVTILDQIEGALTHIDTVGTRADDKTYKRMRMVLESAHRALHNRMHQMGHYHKHNPGTDHREHHTG